MGDHPLFRAPVYSETRVTLSHNLCALRQRNNTKTAPQPAGEQRAFVIADDGIHSL